MYVYELMGIHQTHCSNHFMMYVSQITMLYTFNLNSATYQLHLNKMERKKRKLGKYKFPPQ